VYGIDVEHLIPEPDGSELIFEAEISWAWRR
jgi:hypothetical protein